MMSRNFIFKIFSSMSQTSEQQAQQSTNFAFMQSPAMPSTIPTTAAAAVSVSPSASAETQAAEQPAQQQNQPAAEPQRRFPNIIQDEQDENRDWLDILYSMSRLMILLCLVYFYSSPLRCLIVILIAASIYLWVLTGNSRENFYLILPFPFSDITSTDKIKIVSITTIQIELI